MRLQTSRIVDIGCGTGRVTRQLVKHYPDAQVVALDIAHGMAAFAKRHAGWFSKQRFINADAEYLPLPDQSIDLVFSNGMLHSNTSLDQIFKEVWRVLRPEGLFIFSTFGPDTLKELRHSWALIDNCSHVHGFMDMHDVGDALIRARFVDPVMDVEYFTVTYQDIAKLFQDLKLTGEHNLSAGRRLTLTGKQRIKQLKENYESYRTAAGVLPATYEVIYGHAWKPASSIDNIKGEHGEVYIPLRQIKKNLKI